MSKFREHLVSISNDRAAIEGRNAFLNLHADRALYVSAFYAAASTGLLLVGMRHEDETMRDKTVKASLLALGIGAAVVAGIELNASIDFGVIGPLEEMPSFKQHPV